MKILVTAAHSKELKVIKDRIKSLDLKWTKIYFLQTWIGNYETIFNLTNKLESESFDFVINIWICWYFWEKLPFLQAARIKNFSTNKELIVPIPFIFWPLESLWCSDIIVSSIEKLLDEKYVDMESYWFEFVLNKFNLPRLILKVPADKIWDKFDINIIKNTCESLWEVIDYKLLFGKIINYLDSQTLWTDYEYIKSRYHFTFQEFEIFKFNIKKYEALSNNSFDNFFANNPIPEKKDFLELFNCELIKLSDYE